MGLSKVNFTRAQGNLSTPLAGEDHIAALVLDVATYPANIANGDIFEIFSAKDAEKMGIIPFDGAEGATNYEYGIPYLHISEFFRVNAGGTLYISLADCSTNWDIIDQMQRMAQGKIRQIGVWTRQKMMAPGASALDPYSLRLVADLNLKAEGLGSENQPVSILLSANMTDIDTAGETTNLTLLPSILASYPHVTAAIAQGNSATVKAIQVADTTHANVGWVGALLGFVSRSLVGESVAWVEQYDMAGGHMDSVAFGFGDITLESGSLTEIYPIEKLTRTQLDALSDNGYVFPMHYVSRAGTYVSSSKTCSTGDYNSIERNRAIDKVQRNIRAVMLPFLNAPVKLAPSTGQLSAGSIKKYKARCEDVLQTMVDSNEISGFSVRIDPTQNILETDILYITLKVVPNGKSSSIEVTQGFAVTNQ